MLLPLKKLREKEKMTQVELSKKLNVSPSTIGMYETGRREPDYENLKRIAEIFNVSTDYLLGFNPARKLHADENKKFLDSFLALKKSDKSIVIAMVDRLNNRNADLPFQV